MQVVCIDGIKYALSGNGTALVSGFDDMVHCDITIPSDICGDISVVGISEKAFYKCPYIVSVKLPRSCTYIGDNAFAWCMSLKTVYTGGTVNIGKRAFMGCDRLSDLKFTSDLNCVDNKAFAYCNSLSAIRFPDSLNYLGESVFEGCRYLRYAYIPDHIDVIKSGMFYACRSLCEVEIPSTLKYIDEYSFAYCTSLTLPDISSYTVLNNNAFYECGAIKVNCIA